MSCFGLALTACGATSSEVAPVGTSSAATSKGVSTTVVASGSVPDLGNGGSARADLVRSATAAQKLLRSWNMQRAAGAARRVDYQRRSLIVVLGAGAPDTAYRLRARRVVVRDGRLDVRLDLLRDKDKLGGQSLSRPYVLLSVKRDAVSKVRGTARVRVTRR